MEASCCSWLARDRRAGGAGGGTASSNLGTGEAVVSSRKGRQWQAWDKCLFLRNLYKNQVWVYMCFCAIYGVVVIEKYIFPILLRIFELFSKDKTDTLHFFPKHLSYLVFILPAFIKYFWHFEASLTCSFIESFHCTNRFKIKSTLRKKWDRKSFTEDVKKPTNWKM